MAAQLPLFAPAPPPAGGPVYDPAFAGVRHHALTEGAWVEHQPGWVRGDAALFAALEASTTWHAERRQMYDREVAVPRLTAGLPKDGPGHPLVAAMGAALERRYGARVRHVSLALYRDGADSVAPHGDRGSAALPGALTVSVSLGSPRRLSMRPAAEGTGRGVATLHFELGGGDLFVMGGTCQRTWRHGIAKVASAAPRLAILYWMGPAGPEESGSGGVRG